MTSLNFSNSLPQSWGSKKAGTKSSTACGLKDLPQPSPKKNLLILSNKGSLEVSRGYKEYDFVSIVFEILAGINLFNKLA